MKSKTFIILFAVLISLAASLAFNLASYGLSSKADVVYPNAPKLENIAVLRPSPPGLPIQLMVAGNVEDGDFIKFDDTNIQSPVESDPVLKYLLLDLAEDDIEFGVHKVSFNQSSTARVSNVKQIMTGKPLTMFSPWMDNTQPTPSIPEGNLPDKVMIQIAENDPTKLPGWEFRDIKYIEVLVDGTSFLACTFVDMKNIQCDMRKLDKGVHVLVVFKFRSIAFVESRYDVEAIYKPLKFTVTENPVPKIMSITPDKTWVARDATLLIKGNNFVKSAMVDLNNMALTDLSVVNSTEITVRVPAKSIEKSGTYYIRLINPNGGVADIMPLLVYTPAAKPIMPQ